MPTLLIILISFVIGIAIGRYFQYVDNKNKIKNESLSPEERINNKRKEFDIQYFPGSNRYYPRYKSEYLCYISSTGVYTFRDSIYLSDYSNTEEGALKMIDHCIDLFGVNIKTIKL